MARSIVCCSKNTFFLGTRKTHDQHGSQQPTLFNVYICTYWSTRKLAARIIRVWLWRPLHQGDEENVSRLLYSNPTTGGATVKVGEQLTCSAFEPEGYQEDPLEKVEVLTAGTGVLDNILRLSYPRTQSPLATTRSWGNSTMTINVDKYSIPLRRGEDTCTKQFRSHYYIISGGPLCTEAYLDGAEQITVLQSQVERLLFLAHYPRPRVTLVIDDSSILLDRGTTGRASVSIVVLRHEDIRYVRRLA